MIQRILILTLLAAAAVGSAWMMNRMGAQVSEGKAPGSSEPDYYMEDFTSLSMRDDGTPKDKLQAQYMAHYPDKDTTELLQPKLEVFRQNDTPVFVTADKGWVTSNNNVILLKGKVRLWQNDASGEQSLEVKTSQARVLMKEEYAETDKYATIITKRATITGTGMKAYLKDSRLEVIKHEKTIIEPKPDA